MEKESINLVSLKEFLNGRDWEELTKEEKMEVSEKIANLFSKE